MKSKIGIITQYYKSENYGGNLQAYALCRYLRGMGYDVEQICYSMGPVPDSADEEEQRQSSSASRDPVLYLKLCIHNIINRYLQKKFFLRSAAFSTFRDQIPHSQAVYDRKTLPDGKSYDIFITGSDQVWNPDCHEPAFFLPFVSCGRPKISYAASIGHPALSFAQIEFFRKHLSDFTAVSVREKDAAKLLAPLSPVPVEWVLDPVLLLTREQWDKICAERLIQKPYAFCYFLGPDKKERRLATAYAKKHKLRIICLPYLNGAFQKSDVGFGDDRLYDISPKEFLSLVKYADFVFTDSFHAVVFSEIYHREYVVFHRLGAPGMSTRIKSAVDLFDSRTRFCDTEEKETLAYLESLPPMDPERPLPELDALRKRSYEFLKENLTCQEHSTRCETPPTVLPEK